MHHLLKPQNPHIGLALTSFLVLILSLSACQSESRPLKIAAAASLRDAFQELGKLYTQQNGTQVSFSFAASGVLKTQIEQGAPFDLFASASQLEIETLQAKDLLSGQAQVFAKNSLILATSKQKPHCSWSSMSDKRLAIGNPASVPAGRYAQQSLETLGYWKQIKSKVILTENVRQAVEYLRQGAVDAAIIYASDLEVYKADLISCQVFDSKSHQPINLSIATLRRSAQATEDQKWLSFLSSAQAQQVLKRFGFEHP